MSTNTVAFKQLRRTKFAKFCIVLTILISGLMQWCLIPSVYINETPFFSVSKQNLLGLKSSGWNTVLTSVLACCWSNV
jgi:hypothetical protein